MKTFNDYLEVAQNKKNTVKCPICDGDGRVDVVQNVSGGKKCKVCNGTGEISREKLKSVKKLGLKNRGYKIGPEYNIVN